MQPKEKIRMTGTVIFISVNAGSKSDGSFPFLYEKRDSIRRIMLKDDNPFENHGFDEYDGKVVTVEGTENRSKVIVVEKVELASVESEEYRG